MAAAVTRRFVTVGERQVHYRRTGSGPPAVLLHESPLSSRVLVPFAEALAAAGFTAIALDTPGYGQSCPLAEPQPTVADYAAAVAEAVEALRLGPCLLYGAHTGAQIAIGVAQARPDLLTALIAEGPPILTAEEQADILAHYCPPLDPVWSGAHLPATWRMRRDQAIFWPWFRNERSHRRSADMLPVEILHDGVVDTLRGGAGYGLGYRAAFTFDCGPALAALTVPAHLVVTEGIFLADQLERLPPLPSVSIELLSEDRAAATERLCAIAAQHRPAQPAPPPPHSLHRAGIVTRDYAATSFGQLLARRATESAGRPLVLLHDSPGSGASLEPLLLHLAPLRPALALDVLGHGESDQPPWTDATIDDYARSVIAAVDRLGVADLDLYGTGAGAEIATRVAALASHRVRHLVVAGLDLAPPDVRAARATAEPPLPLPRDDGGHLLELWSRLKDIQSFAPWHDRSREAIRWAEAPPAAQVHALFVETLKGGAGQDVLARAGRAFDPEAALRALATLPTLALATLGGGGRDGGRDGAAAVAALVPQGVAYTLPGPPAAAAAVIDRFLRDEAVA